MKYKIIVDKQPSTNPTSEKRTYEIDIEELRVKGDVYDSLIITKDEAYVMRRLSLSEYHVLSVLENEVKEPLTDLDITLFEGDNYVYLMDMTGNKFYAEYLVKNDFTELYVTENKMNSAIIQSASQIELNVNQKLTGYSTTEEMNSAITQSANSIKSEVSNTLKDYSTTTEMNTAITQKADEITSTVSSTYTTKNELNTAKSEIKQTTDGISSTVSTKVGNNEIISKINQSSESVTINANKLSLSGKEINLTSDNTTIKSTNFNVDKDGKLSCSDANITGGNIELSASANNVSKIKVKNSDGTVFSEIYPAGFKSTFNGVAYLQINPTLTVIRNATSSRGVLFSGNNLYVESNSSTGSANAPIKLEGSSGKVTCTSLTQTSIENQKKNFEKLEKALDILKDIDIYKYNFKDEDDKTKKHIGFVIGENYKYREEVTSNENNGVDLYSFVSLCCKAIQEQQEKIDKLEERLEALENG